MRKTLQDVAGYIKTIMPPEPQEPYAISSVFEAVAPAEKVREGVSALRAFLCRLYDAVAEKGEAFDSHKKVAHEYENRITLSGYYPFLHNVKTALMKMGYQGVLSENAQALLCDTGIWNEKLSAVRNMETLCFLSDCGIGIGGLDLDAKKPNLSDGQTITICYPENPAMLTGLKVMAIAEIDYRTLANQDVFMRCDYRALATEEPDALTILQETIRPLSREVQDFLLQLHRSCLDKGMNCAVEIKGYFIYIKYSFKRKDVWGFNASLNNGFQINVKAQNMEQYGDAVSAFPPVLQDLIARGFGCGRKRPSVGHCDGGCRGMVLSLDDSILKIRQDVETWLDRELSCLKGK